jgi:hypothetical protein
MEHPAMLLDHEKIDPMLDALKLMEGNNIYGRNMIYNCRKAVTRLHGHIFPTKKLVEGYDLLELVKSFSGSVYPFINYRRSQRQSGVEVAMVTLMAHDELVNWKKVSSSKDAAGKRVLLLSPRRSEVLRSSGAFVAMMQPTRGASSSVVVAPSTGTPAPEVQ